MASPVDGPLARVNADGVDRAHAGPVGPKRSLERILADEGHTRPNSHDVNDHLPEKPLVAGVISA